MAEYYTSKKIIDNCVVAIRKPETFYSQDFINYRSRTTDNDRLCTELIAEFLLEEENFKKLDEIATCSRTKVHKKYDMNHQGKYPLFANHDREKIIAIDLYNQSQEQGAFDYIGKIIDYQTPLKTKITDPYGEIDILSVNDNEKDVYILELKRGKAKKSETMLRCVLEAFTYYKIVDGPNLLKEFGKEEYNIRISPLVFIGDDQYNEWVDMNKGNRPNLKALMEKVGATPFFLKPQDIKYRYTVTKG